MNPRHLAPVGLLVAGFVVGALLVTADTWRFGTTTSKDPSDAVALTTSTLVTAGQWDTLQSPQTVDYQVPAGKTLVITTWQGSIHAAAGTNVRLEIGYGDAAVGNSATSPTGAVVVYETSWVTADGAPAEHAVWVPVPAEKYPFIQPHGGDLSLAAVGAVTGGLEVNAP